jgi:hypothetical protein
MKCGGKGVARNLNTQGVATEHLIGR